MSYYDGSSVHVEWAKKMPTWRNGDVKFEAVDVHAPDEFISGLLFEPGGVAFPVWQGDSQLPHYRTSEYAIGTWLENSYLQTARNLYPAFGPVTTLENNPSAGIHTHNFVVRTSQTPVPMGRHLERENETPAEDEEIDMMGMLMDRYHIEVSEADTKAKQQALWRIAFTLNTDATTDDITKPAALSENGFEWNDVSFPIFTFGGETIEADIRGWAFDVNNDLGWSGLVASRYTVGKMKKILDVSVTLNLVPKGRNLFELIRTALESYATDVDLTVKLARNATTDYIQFTHDKMYCYPFDIRPAQKDDWFEGYMVRFHQLKAGSLVPQAIDAYNNDYYENP